MALIYPCSSPLFLLLILLTIPTNGAPVDDVCHQTKNPPICLKTLVSNPRVRNATLPDLAEIGFQTAGLDAVKIQRKFLSLLNSPTVGSKLRAIYAECEKLYVDASATLAAANNDFHGRRYGGVKAKADKASGDVDGCEKAFKNKTSPVHELSKRVGVVVEAIKVIAKTVSK